MRESLAEFLPESELPGGDAGGPSEESHTPREELRAPHEELRAPHEEARMPPLRPIDRVSVADLLAKAVPLQWFEAVAISQSLCAKLCESGDYAGPVQIDAENVFIDEAGSVGVLALRTATGPSAREGVADLLRATLPEKGVPTPIRLLVSQASVSDSLAEWLKTLEYYERPDRPGLVQAVYRRAEETPEPVVETAVQRPAAVAPVPAVAPPVVAVATLPVPVHGERPWGALIPSAAHVLVACGVLVVIAAAVAAGWWIRAQPSREPVTQLALGAAPDAILATAVSDESVAQPPGDWIRLEPEPPPKVRPSSREARRPTAPIRRPTPEVSSQLTDAGSAEAPVQLPLVRSQPEAIAQSAPPQVPDLAPLMPASVDARVVPLPRARAWARARSSSGASIVYSQADADVVPPLAIYPRFPSARPPGVGEDDLAEFEVVISEMGTVEAVRARSVPATMAEAMRMTMNLSAAKAWRFSPGMKDGEPVRYRQVIWVLKH